MLLELRLTILAVAILLISYVFYQLIKKRLSERNALLWMLGCFSIGFLALFPSTLDWAARHLGIDYPPTLLFLVSSILILIMIMQQSIQISILNKEVKELAERLAIEEHDLKAYDHQKKEGDNGETPSVKET